MKRIIAILMIVALAACGGKDEKTALQDQIKERQKQVRQLNKEIKGLQDKLGQAQGGQSAFQVPVQVKNLQPETFNHFFKVNGKVEADKRAFISPETNGRIEKLHIDEGQRVQKGQLLVTLNTDVTRNTIEEVKTNLKLAKKMFQKQKDLWEKEIGSEIEYLRAKNNKESLESRLETLNSQLDMATIKAPFSGIVEEIFMKEGEMASPGMQVVNLVNGSVMKVEGDVAEKYLPHVNVGDTVRIYFPVYGDYVKKAPVRRKGSVINRDSRTFAIEMKLYDMEREVLPNMLSTITVNDYSVDSAIVVPAIIVKEDRKGDYLYRVKKEGDEQVAEKVYVKSGRSYNDHTLIKEGLQINDQVIVTGYEQVSDGTEVKIK